MDETKKPLLIPPEFSSYAEKHGIFQIYERMLKKLVINQPNDPLQTMIELLQEPEDVPSVIVLGPPGSGKRSISRVLCEKLNCQYICKDHFSSATNEAEFLKAVKAKISEQASVDKGWLLEGIPETRQQALELQASGIFPKHVVLLECPDTVLVERVMGKRVDSLTGDVYHVTFDPPSKPDVKKRLVDDPNTHEPVMLELLHNFHRNIPGIMRCFENCSKTVNADQPKTDVISQVQAYLNMLPRTNAPHTPKILLLGPVGCGKSVQAALLANKYGLVNVNFEELVKQTLANDSNLGEAMRPYKDRNVSIPDELLLRCLTDRISQLDATRRGWVLHGFPKTRMQVESLALDGYEPNRVIVMDLPNDVLVERMSLRTVDPITGERYHLLYNPPRNVEIKMRLRTHPDDEESAVLERCRDYYANIEDMLEYYTEAQRINADQDLQMVFECIETVVVNPLPKSEAKPNPEDEEEA